MEDLQILHLLRTDPDRGMNELVKQYSGLVCSVIRGKFSGFNCVSTDVEDCASDTFSDFYLSLPGFNPEAGQIKGYLAAAARNHALNFLKKNRNVQVTYDSETEDSEAPQILMKSEVSVADEAAERDLKKRLLDAVKALGEPDRSIIIGKYYLGRKSKELAKRFGMTPANIDNRAHRAVERLKAALTAEG